MSEHSAKRQRVTGSFSPASPPYHLAAKTSETKPPIIHPSTPTSPPYPPMNSLSDEGYGTIATAAASTAMTPPSSVSMSQHASQSGLSAGNQPPFLTPASTAGLSNSMHMGSDGDAMMEDSQDDEMVRLGEHRRSNHNRQNGRLFSPEGGVAAAKGVCGRQLFNLCQSTHKVSEPHTSQNLFELYGLNSLARSVARTDPITGEKINKLRKSYEGHIKALQIAGKPKAVKMEGKLTGPMSIPDQEYHALMVQGKEIHHALNAERTGLTPAFDSLLSSALGGIGPGPLPPGDTAKFRTYLGTDEAVKSKVGPEGPPHRVLPSASATPNAHTPSAAQRLSRPERAGSKRQYTDHSFQGYGEGFADDYAESTGGEDNPQGGIAKKRRLGFERASHQVEVGGARR